MAHAPTETNKQKATQLTVPKDKDEPCIEYIDRSTSDNGQVSSHQEAPSLI